MNIDSTLLLLVAGFFVIALVYSSVGFGGGSSYLALLAQPVFMLTPDEIRPAALLCNIIVVTGGCIIFYRQGKFDLREMWPFLVLSVPFAYLGGTLRLEDRTFFIVLAIILMVASFLLWIQHENITGRRNVNNPTVNAVIGGSIGFLSGLVSIGGGIFLSPLLHLLNWSEARKISALASLFILVNSVSGLAGQLSRGFATPDWKLIVPLLVAVLAGGQIGSRLGARKFNATHIKRITAVLILVAAVNILAEHL